MLLPVPNYITLVFIITVLITLTLFLWTIKRAASKALPIAIAILLFILIFQGILSYTGFYTENLFSIPPRFPINILPPLIFIIFLFNSKKGKSFIDKLSLGDLALISIVRIPVEICIYWFAMEKIVPNELTFEGRNWDILSGITAPLIAYAYYKGYIGRKTLLIWNFVALILVIAIVSQAILAIPSPFQQMGIDQPNIAVLYFPFNWLASFIVPIVFFTHFAALRQLLLRHE